MKLTVSGGDEALVPVYIRCPQCGAREAFGGHGYTAWLDELTDWAHTHECPRGLTTN